MVGNFDCFNLHCHHEAICDSAGDYTQADAHLALPLPLVLKTSFYASCRWKKNAYTRLHTHTHTNVCTHILVVVL